MNTETQRNLAQEQLKQRKPNWLERWLGLDQQQEPEPERAMEPAPEPERTAGPVLGFFAGMIDIMASAQEKAAYIGDSVRAFFQGAPREMEIVHIGADKSAAQINPEVQELQVRDSLAAVLGTFTPSQTPAFQKPSPETYRGPQMGMSLRQAYS